MPKTKAETSFDRQLKFLLGDARRRPDPGPVMCVDQAAADRFRREQETPLPLDTGALATLFERMGAYLELVGDDSPLGEERTFEWPRPEAPAEGQELEPA